MGCVPRAENEVVVYSAADREFAEPILKSFERKHSEISVATTYDLESTKTVGLVTRIQNEAEDPRCDLFWNNELMHTLRLDRAGMLKSVVWDIPRDWPKQLRSSRGTWIAFAARARVLLVNKTLLPDSKEWPTSVEELADPKWRGKCAVAQPLFGTTATHFAVLHYKMGTKRAGEWFRQVKENAVVLGGNKQVAQAVSSGQVAFGLTDTDDALIESDSGLPVAIVYPDQQSTQLGTLLIPNSLCVLQKARHPVAAIALGNFLISEDIEGRLAMGQGGHIPIRPNHPQVSRAKPPKNLRTMDVDFDRVSHLASESSATLMTVFNTEP